MKTGHRILQCASQICGCVSAYVWVRQHAFRRLTQLERVRTASLDTEYHLYFVLVCVGETAVNALVKCLGVM